MIFFIKRIEVRDCNTIRKIKNEFLIPQLFSIGKLNTQILYVHIYSKTNH